MTVLYALNKRLKIYSSLATPYYSKQYLRYCNRQPWSLSYDTKTQDYEQRHLQLELISCVYLQLYLHEIFSNQNIKRIMKNGRKAWEFSNLAETSLY